MTTALEREIVRLSRPPKRSRCRESCTACRADAFAGFLSSARGHEGDAKLSAFCQLAGITPRGGEAPPEGAWHRWLELLACLRRLQGDQWPVLLQVLLLNECFAM